MDVRTIVLSALPPGFMNDTHPSTFALSRRIVALLCVILSLTQITSSSPVQAEASIGATAETSPSDVNVLFIVLDEAPLFPLLKTDGTINRARFPGFASLADTATWYRNAMTTAQRTTEAVPAVLTGNWPTFKNYPYLKSHPNNLFTLLRDEKKLNVYQAITHLCPKNACANAPSRDQRKLLNQVRELQKTIAQAATATTPSLNFAHVLLPHRPWSLVPDGRYMSDVLRYPDPRSEFLVDRRRDNYQSMLRQYVATDLLIGDLVTTMKASPNWDNTMIVVTADHGITFEPGKSYRDTIDIKSPGTMEDIFRVPLFIKYPHQATSSVSDCAASTVDLVPTVLAVSSQKPAANTDGQDLSTSCPRRTSRTVRWPAGSFQLSTTFPSLVKRVRYYDRWIDADSDVDGIYRSGLSGSLLGTTTPSSESTTTSLTWRLNLARNYQSIGSGRLSPVPARASGLVFPTKKMCRRCEGLIAINGRFVGVVSELAGTRPHKEGHYFSSSLMTRIMEPGPATVELWIADWSKKTPSFQRVGPPRK
jgi:hypothetical protein